MNSTHHTPDDNIIENTKAGMAKHAGEENNKADNEEQTEEQKQQEHDNLVERTQKVMSQAE